MKTVVIRFKNGGVKSFKANSFKTLKYGEVGRAYGFEWDCTGTNDEVPSYIDPDSVESAFFIEESEGPE